MIEVTAAIIQQNGKVLICQRPANKNCGLLWEFPGGKIEYGETPEQCLVRECKEELGVIVKIKRKFAEVVQDYSDRTVHLQFFLCEFVDGTIKQYEHNDIAWIGLEEIENYEFCPADKKMLMSNTYSEFFS